jgi:7,8-dihydroneopterin aldolase/epimerase/oxygenase
MGKIAIEGMKFYAFHGYYEEEQKIGNDYQIDIYIDTNFSKAATKDDLEGTVNYETIYRIVKIEMQKKTKLLEALGQRILDRIKGLFDTIENITIRISKLRPPISGDIARVWIEMSENYQVKCGKCTKTFLSHLKDDCWTKHGQIYPETRATLTRNHGALICKSCLEPHFIQPPAAENDEDDDI